MMSLSGKKLLIVGKENKQIIDLEDKLRPMGAIISITECEDISADEINNQKIDVIILNHQHGGELCKNMVDVLRGNELTKIIPVFALVNESAEEIQEAMLSGVTDYITKTETTDSVIQKLKVVFNADDTFGDSSVIDITPTEAATSMKGIKVFIIEDDPLLRNLLSIKMDKSSFPYKFSHDGKNAVSDIKEFKPDAIILDLMLPGISGFDVLTDIKADADLRDIPVIVFSNRDGATDREKAKELGAVCFYVKAMTDLSELIEKIESLVDKK